MECERQKVRLAHGRRTADHLGNTRGQAWLPQAVGTCCRVPAVFSAAGDAAQRSGRAPAPGRANCGTGEAGDAEAFAVTSRRKTRIATVGFGFAILFLVMAALIAWWANDQRKDALAGELIATAENLAKQHPDQSSCGVGRSGR